MTRVSQVLDKARSDGQPAAAITDHGNLFGALKFHRAAREAGVRPILGCEAYVAPGSRPGPEPGPRQPAPGPARPQRDRLPEPDAPFLDRAHRGLLLPPARRLRDAGAPPRGPHRALRLSQGDRAARHPGRRGGPAGGGRALPGGLREGELLPRGHGPQPGRGASGGGGAADRAGAAHRGGAAGALEAHRHPAGGHERLALRRAGGRRRARPPALHQHEQPHSRPEAAPVRHRGVPLQEFRRDGAAVPGIPGRLPEHAADRGGRRGL